MRRIFTSGTCVRSKTCLFEKQFFIGSKFLTNRKVDTSKISTLIENVTKEITAIDVLLDVEKQESKTSQLQKLNEELKQGQDVLDKPAKEQQKFLDGHRIIQLRTIPVRDRQNVGGFVPRSKCASSH